MLIKLTQLTGEPIIVNTDNIEYIKPIVTGSYIDFIKRYANTYTKETPDEIYEIIRQRELYKNYE